MSLTEHQNDSRFKNTKYSQKSKTDVVSHLSGFSEQLITTIQKLGDKYRFIYNTTDGRGKVAMKARDGMVCVAEPTKYC